MDFSTGVSGYVKCSATVFVNFPVDIKGNADVRCEQCKYLRRASRSCALNDAIVEYPDKYVGTQCPLKIIEE